MRAVVQEKAEPLRDATAARLTERVDALVRMARPLGGLGSADGSGVAGRRRPAPRARPRLPRPSSGPTPAPSSVGSSRWRASERVVGTTPHHGRASRRVRTRPRQRAAGDHADHPAAGRRPRLHHLVPGRPSQGGSWVSSPRVLTPTTSSRASCRGRGRRARGPRGRRAGVRVGDAAHPSSPAFASSASPVGAGTRWQLRVLPGAPCSTSSARRCRGGARRRHHGVAAADRGRVPAGVEPAPGASICARRTGRWSRRPRAARSRRRPAPGARRGARRDARQEHVPGDDEPRDPDADERHPRHRRPAGRHAARATISGGCCSRCSSRARAC